MPTYKSHHIFYLGLITSVKNQGECGSCAAFAAGSVIETCLKKAVGGKLSTYDISEQHLIDCAYQKPNADAGANGIPNSNSLKISEIATIPTLFSTLKYPPSIRHPSTNNIPPDH